MKNTLLLFAALLLFSSCDKREYSHPFPGGRPEGLGDANFSFSMSEGAFQMDSIKILCGYHNNAYQSILADTTLLMAVKWESLRINYKKGDSIWADVRVWGTLKQEYTRAIPIKGIQFDTTYYDSSAPPVADSIREEAFIATDTSAGAPFTYHVFGAWKF